MAAGSNRPSRNGESVLIAIDDVLVAVLLAERDKHLRLAAGVPDGAQVDLSLVRLPADALMFPSPDGAFGFTRLRNTKSVTEERVRGSANLALIDYGSTIFARRMARRCLMPASPCMSSRHGSGMIRLSCFAPMPSARTSRMLPQLR